MSIQNFIETAEFKNFDNLTEDVYNNTISFVSNMLKLLTKVKLINMSSMNLLEDLFTIVIT